MFENKKIFILGMARSGYEAAKVLGRNNKVVITDMKEQEEDKVKELQDLGVEVIICNDPLPLLDETFDYVVKNPGIKLDHPLVLKAKELSIPVTNEVEVAYQLLKGKVKIIGITGSNGKTTTTTLIYELLKKAGVSCLLGGNIGLPVCALVDASKEGDTLVLEISGHQLHDVIEFRTDISVLTNLSEVHTDHFGTYENYKKNKVKIFDFHTKDNIAIINLENADSLTMTANIKSTKLYFSSKKEADACIKDNAIYFKGERIVDIKDIKIPGVHNLENIMCAIMATKQFGISNEVIVSLLKEFGGVEHRIELVEKINNRVFYNDSKSTNVTSTKVALASFKTPVILLLGGLDRNLPFDDLESSLAYTRTIICYGQTKDKIKEFADRINKECIVVETLEEATKLAFEMSQENDTILLSPACASWDQFKDFEERGRKFKEYVRSLKH